MCCLAGAWWGIIVILLEAIAPHEEKFRSFFTCNGFFYGSPVPAPQYPAQYRYLDGSPTQQPPGKEYAANGNGQCA